MSIYNRLSGSRTAKFCGAACVLAFAAATPAAAVSLSRSVDVNATPAQVWSMIGPFCAIKEWHPAIGTCVEATQAGPVRTLVTKDGKATFKERQTGRSDAQHQYSYVFTSSPLPVSNYASTLQVTARDKGASTVTWSSTYTPEPGKENVAADALGGIYESGLEAIKAKVEK